MVSTSVKESLSCVDRWNRLLVMVVALSRTCVFVREDLSIYGRYRKLQIFHSKITFRTSLSGCVYDKPCSLLGWSTGPLDMVNC